MHFDYSPLPLRFIFSQHMNATRRFIFHSSHYKNKNQSNAFLTSENEKQKWINIKSRCGRNELYKELAAKNSRLKYCRVLKKHSYDDANFLY